MSQFSESKDITENDEDCDSNEGATVVDLSETVDPNMLTRGHFLFGRTLGEGSYARVVRAKLKVEGSPEFAVKIMEKSFIKKEKKIKYVLREKQILSMISHPFVIKLLYTFQDTDYLYMCMELAGGGELLGFIRKCLRENEALGLVDVACEVSLVRYYIAELVEALQYLHDLNIVHMDIKPENILLTSQGHIKIGDFGTAMKDIEVEAMSDIFVGTAEYVSPEILNEEGIISKACDLWAVGCILHQMLCGRTPFRADTEYLIFVAINGHLDESQPLTFPEVSIAEGPARDLILALLRKDPNQRLGAGALGSGFGYDALKAHPFFGGLDFDSLLTSEPPYVPEVHESTDTLHDGALDDWLLEGEATPIQKELRAGSVSVPAHSVDQAVSKWSRFLTLPGEREVFSGLVLKRVGLFSKKRQLILTDAPRLLYVCGDSMELKGEIPWTAEHPVTIRLMSSTVFDALCTTTGRAYHFTACDGTTAQTWADQVQGLQGRARK